MAMNPQQLKSILKYKRAFKPHTHHQISQQMWERNWNMFSVFAHLSMVKPHLLQRCRKELFLGCRTEAISSYGGNPANLSPEDALRLHSL